ncbi:MAG: autotransporter strand-loop-strand O-heptosyltransferase [Oxalobacter sp.]|nr:autotransporter strand-loop-strand O-heptosyltransferase [Oxalobacter sp.]
MTDTNQTPGTSASAVSEPASSGQVDAAPASQVAEQPNSGTAPAQNAQGKANPLTGPYSVPPPDIPTQQGPYGIRYDFNDGARLLLPPGDWHAEIIDDESGNIIFACDSPGGWITSTKKYFIWFAFKVWKKGESKPCFEHTMDLKGKDVLISYPVGTLGDLIGWFPYAERFREQHGCKIECTMGPLIIELFKDQYPEITFSTPDKVKNRTPYATYRIGLFFKGDTTFQPIDFRKVGLHRTAGYILGVDPEEIVPKFKLGSERQIQEPYVCIATQASTQCKYWNNGYGWQTVIRYLKRAGYRVLCIDMHPTYGLGYVWNHIPHDAEDFTGNIPLQKRIELIEHADFFIGLGSGLSWLAWGCKVPVILISGFSLPICEFKTPYRVYSTHGCMGCWDDVNENFDSYDFFWCPKYKNTDRQYECTRLITGRQVIKHVQRVMRDIGKEPPPIDEPVEIQQPKENQPEAGQPTGNAVNGSQKTVRHVPRSKRRK